MKVLIITLIILLVVLFLKRAEVLAFSAKLKLNKGDTKEALKLFRFANRFGKMSPQSQMYYGYVLLRTGDLNTARQILTLASMGAGKVALKKHIKSILALVTWKEGDLDGAIEMMEEVLEDFSLTSCYQNLGLLYVLKGDGEKAKEFNLKAREYNDDDLVIMDNLAESYVLCGEYENAKALYEELLEKEPHFPEPYYGYGMLLCELGENEKGIEYIRESLTKRFSFLSVKTKEEVEEILKKM